jgi:hypothetical protein
MAERILMPLDITTRAVRAANKRNRKTRASLPLLDAQQAIPSDWLTTPDAQRVRLERQSVLNVDYFERLAQAEREETDEAARLHEIARHLVSPERFAELEYGMRYIADYPSVYALDYWHNALAKINPVYCPHYPTDHYVSRILGDSHCPICNLTLASLPFRGGTEGDVQPSLF